MENVLELQVGQVTLCNSLRPSCQSKYTIDSDLEHSAGNTTVTVIIINQRYHNVTITKSRCHHPHSNNVLWYALQYLLLVSLINVSIVLLIQRGLEVYKNAKVLYLNDIKYINISYKQHLTVTYRQNSLDTTVR